MNKVKFVTIIIIIFLIVSLLTFLNYDKIIDFFTNKQWEIADSIGKIEYENYVDAFNTNSDFFIINGTEIQGYSDTVKKVFEKSISFKDVLSKTAGDYAIIAEKNSTDVFVINKDEEVWNTSINNASILGVSINKNGYSAVIYSQAGYKSLIKVFSSAGEELFTNYLASTYAIDVAISNDNKTLAIAEIDTNGVSLTSRLKLIDVQSASENNVKKIDLDGDELISDIEFDENNHLIVLTDVNVIVLKNENILELINFKDENIINANISNQKNLVAVKLNEESLFNVKCELCIYNFNDSKNVKTYMIEETPNRVVTCNDVIAVDTGSKIIFLNSSANFLKKCQYNGQLKNISLFDNGKTAVLLFRDTAEFIKVGGM
ncbi:MAG: hypothetical protein IJ220_06090 [Clostridia bacterium]|nr:hypothetical protein [Clostridia bacterium]